MKHFQLITIALVAFCLVTDIDGAVHNGTRKTRQVLRKKIRQVEHSGSDEGLIKGIAGGLRNFGNNFIGDAQNAVKDLGPIGGILSGIGDVVNYAINGTDQIVNEANNFAGNAAREAYNEGKNIVGKGDQDPISGLVSGVGNIISGAANGAANIAGGILDNIGGAANTLFNDIL